MTEMTLIHKPKKILFVMFIALGIFVMTACNNSSDSNSSASTASTDTTAAVDTASKTIVKKARKGKASASIAVDSSMKMAMDKEGVYSKTDVKPVYPGGEAALSKFIEENISYPQDAVDQNAEGTSTVSFVVDEKGMVTKPATVGKTVGHGLDEEAARVVSKMPAWKPGMVKGKAVKTRLQLPVTFKLEE